MKKGNSWCEQCVDATTCTKDIAGYKKFTFEGRPYGNLFDTENEAWDTGGKKYDGSFEVYPVCR